jgi:hypothetical protein
MPGRLTTQGSWLVDQAGRKVLFRGVNLGGDCKVPYPRGGTNFPSDFKDHRTVSFVGRPFPLTEADEHLGRIAHWGFNGLRLLTTWEAVEHAGPGQYDEAYLDYLAEVTRRAGEHGLYVFIDFHQDVWSRMSGGDGAPGWTFEAVGLDFTKFHAAGAAHVMQAKYDYARGGRQEDRYPMMSWGQNYRMPANAIMWTLFFAGRDFAPDFKIEGQNSQDYLQGHYLGAMRAVARRVKHMDHVLGFDTLNEPSTGWIGKELSYRHLERSNKNDRPVTPGPAWSALDGLLVAQGQARTIPHLAFDPAKMKVGQVGENVVNPDGVNIWLPGHECPFRKAGVYDRNGAIKETWFSERGGRDVDPEADYMVPFFNRVAETIRAENPDWLVFAEFDPFQTLGGHPFPGGCPERMVNASHWYDIVTLVTKTFMYPTAINPFNGKTLEGRQAILDHYVSQLAKIKFAAEGLQGGAPTLIGEFGIPFDLDGAAAYKAWGQGDRSDGPWESHVTALELMYEAMDKLFLNTAQWNYTASNSNDLAAGDGWNQEDLSIFSRDQHAAGRGKDSGGRAVKGFARPYARATQGTPLDMAYDRAAGRFTLTFDADVRIAAPTEIVLPEAQFPGEFHVTAPGLTVEVGAASRILRLWAKRPGRTTVTVRRGEAGALA